MSANIFLQNVLKKIFKNQKCLTDVGYFKNMLVGKLNRATVVKVSICDHTCIDNYSCLKIEVINKIHGVVDVQYFTFGDIIGNKSLFCGNIMSPYIWREKNDTASWYSYTPSDADYALMLEIIEQYLSFYKDI